MKKVLYDPDVFTEEAISLLRTSELEFVPVYLYGRSIDSVIRVFDTESGIIEPFPEKDRIIDATPTNTPD